MQNAFLFLGFPIGETIPGFKEQLKASGYPFQFLDTVTGLSLELWRTFSMIFVDTRLLTASREFELLDRFQKTERKPLILYESNRLEKTEIDQVLSLSPWFIYTGFQWQQMLESALSFARTFEVSEKELAKNIALDPAFLFFSGLNHDLRELLNGLSAMDSLFNQSSTPSDLSKTLASLIILQKKILSALEQWTAIVDNNPDLNTPIEHPMTMTQLVSTIRTYFGKKLLFEDLDIQWVFDPAVDSQVFLNGTRIIFLWVFLSSIALNLSGAQRAEFVFSKKRIATGPFLEFSIFLENKPDGLASNLEKMETNKEQWNALILRKLLSFCRATVMISSHKQEGMIISVLTPIEESSGAQTVEFESVINKKQAIVGRKLNILLAEDDVISQKLTSLLIRKKGWSITPVSNGEEAVREASGRPYDIVLMDIQMPVMNGLEAARKIRSMENISVHHLPIIALTAHTLRDDRATYTKAGIDACVSKPIVEDELYTTILQVWARFSETASYIENPPANINRVLSLLEGNREELSGLIKESLRYFPDQLETIKNSIRERNARELSKSAHKIKGSFSSFDAKRCFELALELENIGREQSFEDADITYRMLVSETARLKEYLLNFL